LINEDQLPDNLDMLFLVCNKS